MVVAVSAFEKAALLTAARREGMAVGAWLGEVGVRHALHGDRVEAADGEAGGWRLVLQALIATHTELAATRRLLRNVGANLNQVAAAANTTGRLVPQTVRVLALVDRTVGRVDDGVAAVAAAVRSVRGPAVELPGSSRRRRGGA